MGPIQKKVTIGLWALVLCALVGIVVGKALTQRKGVVIIDNQAADARAPLHDILPAPLLVLTDQTGAPFSTASLKGKVWIADFIFTSCGNICPIMSSKMAELQKLTPPGVNFVSFSVDPKTDTPAVLKEYGTRLGADFSRWHFLTGSTDQMADAAIQMKIATSTSNPLSHSDRFMLINANGMIVGLYSGLEPADLKAIAADATKLANESSVAPQTAPAGKV